MKNNPLIIATVVISFSSSSYAAQLPSIERDQYLNQQIYSEQKTFSEANSTPKQRTIRDEAFKQLLNKSFPMRPDQIIEFRKELAKSKEAVATATKLPPTPVSSTITVDLAPGTTSPVIRLSTGFVTSMVFLDSTGQPWKIGDYSLGNSRDFNIQWDQKTNTMFIQSLKDHAHGNLAVRLADLNTPIMISLVNGQREVDYRVDLHVKARGPAAVTPLIDESIPTGTRGPLLSVLDGVPPQGSTAIDVSDNHGQAWLINNKILFRTKLNLLSPAWSAKVSSADGTKVYEFARTPVVLASEHGKTIKILLKGT